MTGTKQRSIACPSLYSVSSKLPLAMDSMMVRSILETDGTRVR
jgi:hypothetical protein